ncbi:MAG: hypothetical protein ACK4OK_03845 [Thermoflexus sp.]
MEIFFRIVPGAFLDFRWEIGLPREFNGLRLEQIEVDGQTTPHQERPIRGIPYAWVRIPIRPASIQGFYR